MRRFEPSRASLQALTLLVLAFACASAVPVAPSKSWCRTSSTSAEKKNYALFPSGKCALCQFGVYGPNHCFEWGGQICPQGAPYTMVKKGGYRRCVCNKGWYGSPKGDKAGVNVSFGGTQDAGCAWCDIFATTSQANSSSLLQCDLCRGDLQFYGEGPFCIWDPVRFASPNCSLPEPWGTFGVKLPGSAGCGCRAGYFGTWPDCRPCPKGLTAPAGNGLTCTCDRAQGFLPSSSSSAICKCDFANGYYATYQNKSACVLCKSLTGTQAMVVPAREGTDGFKCGCNTSKGYGLNIAAKGQPICLKCSDVNAVLHKPSMSCRCKAGYGIESAYDSAAPGLDNRNYCVPCATAETQVDSKGVCSCKPGFARSRFTSGRDCLPCTTDNKTPVLQPSDYPQPVCDCKPNYEGLILFADSTCTACKPGLVADASRISPTNPPYYDENCRCQDVNAVFDGNNCNSCRTGYFRKTKTSNCQMSAKCKASRWVGRFWGRSAIGAAWNGTFFPSTVLERRIPPSKTVKYKTLDLDVTVPVKGPFAAVFDIVLWGKKGSPRWLSQGQGRFGMNSRMIAKWTSSWLAWGNVVFLPSSGVRQPFVADLGRVATYGDDCQVIRLAWWSVEGGATLKAKIVRTQGALGAWYTQ